MAEPAHETNLLILYFDHRSSFQKDLFAANGEPSEDQVAAITDVKHLIFEAIVEATRPCLLIPIAKMQHAGIEPVIWKIEGLDRKSDNEAIAKQSRAGGRDHVTCIVLVRDTNDEQLDEWVAAAAPLPEFLGFEIGRSIWLDTLKSFVANTIDREAAVTDIATRYLKFIQTYREHEVG